MTECKSCNKEHFIPSNSGLCLLCQMKSKKSANIQKTKSAAIADYQKKIPEKYFEKDGGFNVPTENPLEAVEEITIDMF